MDIEILSQANSFPGTEKKYDPDILDIETGLPIINERLPELKNLLHEGRKKRGLKQKDVAELIGVTPTVINRIETGTTLKPSKKILEQIQPYTGIGYSKLLFICGYPSDMEREVFYSMDGKRQINYTEISESIYHADADLLESMVGIEKISYKHARVLRKLIITMKRDAEIKEHKETKSENLWSSLFNSLIDFLSNHLSKLGCLLQLSLD